MKIDLHLHTSLGSACAYMDFDQMIQGAKAAGLDGVCITDHDHIWNEDTIDRLGKKHNFLVMGGAEIATDEGEILVYGLHRSLHNVVSAEKLRNIVDEEKGFMSLAHPFRYEPRLVGEYDEVALLKSKKAGFLKKIGQRRIFDIVDSIETYNGQSGRSEKQLSDDMARHLRMQGTGGSDAHAALGVGACYTLFKERVTCEKDMIILLKQGAFNAVDSRWKD